MIDNYEEDFEEDYKGLDEEEDEEDFVLDEEEDEEDFDIDKITSSHINKEQKSKKVSKPKLNTVKPKLIGKHSLSHDSIFKGKKTIKHEDEYETEHIIKNAGGSLDVNEDVLDMEESRTNIDYYRETRLKKEIKNILEEYTDINFLANRRKPSKTDFNAYFALLLKDLSQYGYTKSEIFIELSGYFSDNYWNMFQLLENKYSNIIISELKDKYGLSDMNKINFL